MQRRRLIVMLSLVLCIGLPGLAPAVWAKGGDNSGHGGGDHDDADDHDDDHDDDNSGSGSGSGSTGSGSDSGGSQSAGSGGYGGAGVQVFYADGSTEILRNGIYERIDARGRVRDRHAETGADRRRMGGAETLLTSAAPDGPVIGVAIVDEGGASVRMIDSSGWREAITGSTYLLTDPNGNTVTKRRATPRDKGRIRALLGL